MSNERRRLLYVSQESTKGTYVTPATALLVQELEIRRATEYEMRAGTGLYIGGNEVGSLGPNLGVCRFKTQFMSTGAAAALDAGLAIMLQGCGFLKTSEVYTFPTSSVTAQKCCSFGSNELIGASTLFKSLSGAMGTVTFEKTMPGNKLTCSFEFFGVYREIVDAAVPAWSPSVVAGMKASAFTIATAAKKIASFSLDCGQNVIAEPDANGTEEIASYIITDAEPRLMVDPETELAAGYDYDGVFTAQTTAAISMVFNDGTYTATFAMPAAEIIEIGNKERDKLYAWDLTYRLNNSSGDDALTITMGSV
jgi:hypothetical protein